MVTIMALGLINNAGLDKLRKLPSDIPNLIQRNGANDLIRLIDTTTSILAYFDYFQYIVRLDLW